MKLKYCPECKQPLKELANSFYCSRCQEKIYKNSKPCAGILPIKSGKVFLAKRAIEPHKGAFDIIGGFLNNGEHPEMGTVRETKEETGLDIRIIELLGIYVDQCEPRRPKRPALPLSSFMILKIFSYPIV